MVYAFNPGQNVEIPLNTDETVKLSFDYKVTDGTFNIAIFCQNGSNYGYFAFDKYGSVDRYDGMTIQDLGNGYYHVEFTILNLTKYSGNTNNTLSHLYIRGMWSDATGEITNLELA